jgi:hypothetical protein
MATDKKAAKAAPKTAKADTQAEQQKTADAPAKQAEDTKQAEAPKPAKTAGKKHEPNFDGQAGYGGTSSDYKQPETEAPTLREGSREELAKQDKEQAAQRKADQE